MIPKTKRRLKWVATQFEKGDSIVYRHALSTWCYCFKWSMQPPDYSFKTKRQAIAACERHARENPPKK